MRIGFLHVGESRHGVCRYGRMLAGECAARAGLEVIQSDLCLTRSWASDALAIDQAARRLADADLIHIQYNRAIWGEGWYQLRALRRFAAGCHRPLVATLHDVYPGNPWREWRSGRSSWLARFKRLRYSLRHRVPSRLAIRWLLGRCQAALVCFECERERLRKFSGSAKLRVIGHFVESRPELPDVARARRDLAVEDRRVVTLLGFIHRRKGHDLAVDALPLLPDDVLLVFAGAPSPGNERLVAKLVKRAARSGAADRLRVTGFLAEPDLNRWLAATDLAICPFRFLSASGSMATWISAGRPVLAFQGPQIDEYRQIAPQAFAAFEPFTARAFATAIRDCLERAAPGRHPAVGRLAERFSLARVMDEHVDLYGRLVRPAVIRSATDPANRDAARVLVSDDREVST